MSGDEDPDDMTDPAEKETGTIYLLHISAPLYHAAHYLGFTLGPTPAKRVAEHLAGRGSPLVKAALAAGSTIELVRTWEGKTRDDERAFKNHHGSKGLCPICLPAYNERARDRMRKIREARVATKGKTP